MVARHRLSRAHLPMRSGAAVTWLPVLVGIGIMAGFMIYGVTVLRVGGDPGADTPVDVQNAATLPQPSGSASPAPSEPAATDSPTPSPTPDKSTAAPDPLPDPPPAPPPPPEPPAAPPAPAPDPDVVAEYNVEASFDREFIAAVRISNTSDRPQGWTVRLVFDPNVGELRDFWVDGTPQPVAQRSGDGHAFTSTVAIEAGSQVVLRVRYDRSGADSDPSTCTVNGVPCTLS